MELKIAILLVVISVSNVLAIPTYSQVAKVSLDMKNASLEQVMDEIETQSEFYFVFNQKQIDVNRVVDIQAENKLITDILPGLFKGTDVNYVILDRKILLSTDVLENLSKILVSETGSQQTSISGTITDASTGEAMAGVNIQVKGTTFGAISDVNGKYSISSGIDQNTILVFSFIGYVTQETPVTGKSVINISLISEVTGLEEVVVIGYGTTKKATLTGSLATVSGDAIQTSPAINFTNTLAGKLPGLVTVNYSGEPGKDTPTIRIRGLNTLGNNSPLVVIDGVPGRDLSSLDPSFIESITVLKDASAAIYGARAANGVILITSKRGTIGKPEVNVKFNYGLSQPTVLPKMADAASYATMVNEINIYQGRTPPYTEEQIQKFRDGSDPWLYPNVDFFKETFRSSTPQNDGNISIRGGTENIKYFLTSGFKYQDAIYKNSNCDYKQGYLRANFDGKISDNISLSLDISGTQATTRTPGISTFALIGQCIASFPYQLAYYTEHRPASGHIGGQNPVIMGTDKVGYDRTKNYGFGTNAKLLVTIPWVKNLSITGNVAYDISHYSSKKWETPWTLWSWDRMTYDENGDPFVTPSTGAQYFTNPQLTQSTGDGNSLLLNLLINYDVRIAGKHNIRMLAGSEKTVGTSENLSAFRRDFVSPALDQMFAGSDAAKNNGGSATKGARLNYFGRINYNYLEKYLLEFVWRYDGSYIFPEKGRFGFFPGISAGWRISEEGFWKNNISFINYFKLRGSWGQTGNDLIEPFQYLSSFGFTSIPVVFGTAELKALSELRIANPNVTWEIANQSNFGFDSEIFGGKIQFSAEYFYNLRTNILWYRTASVPILTGISLPRENIGEVINRGFEVQLGYKNRIRDFSYEVSFNGAYANNKIKFWDETPGIPEYQQSTGKPMNTGLFYQALGIFKDQVAVDAYPHWKNARPGDIIFKDVNEDGKIDGLDMIRNDKSEIPKFTGGLSINLGYKNFYSSIFFQGAAGAVRIRVPSDQGLIANFFADDFNGRWTQDNPDATKPRTWSAAGEYWSITNNTFWLKNNNYLRLKNLQIGYNVPKVLSEKLNIRGLSIYFTGLNLLTFTPETVYDPETFGLGVYPLSKVYNFGISLTF